MNNLNNYFYILLVIVSQSCVMLFSTIIIYILIKGVYNGMCNMLNYIRRRI